MKNLFKTILLAATVMCIAMAAGVPLLPALGITAFAGMVSYFIPSLPVPGSTTILGYAPQFGARTQVMQSGTATDIKTGATSAVGSPDMNIEPDMEFEIVLTNTSADTDVADVVIVPYSHDSTASTAVANITLTSSAGSRANTMEFFKNHRLTITEWHLQVTSGSSATVYSQKLEKSTFVLNGTDKSSLISLARYRDSNGGEILDTADIFDQQFVVSGWNRLRIKKMPFNTQLTIRCKVGFIELPQQKVIS